jgi:hypothetical protein
VRLLADRGSTSVTITASYGSLTASAVYRAYNFMSYSLAATRTQLRKLGCDYETAYLTASGSITMDGMTVVANIDVSNLVSITSDNPSVVQVSGRLAKGVVVGSTTVRIFSPVTGSLTALTITVSSTSATVQQLISYAYSSLVVTPTSFVLNELATAAVQVQPILLLTAELQTATVLTYAMNDDGVWTDVSRYSTLSLGSTVIKDINIFKNVGGWQLVIPNGAAGNNGVFPVITASLTDSCFTPLILNGFGYAKTNLTIPINVAITATAPALAR